MTEETRLTELLIDSRLTDTARVLGAYIASKGPGEHEIPYAEFAVVAHGTPSERTLRRALRELELHHYVDRTAGGRGHASRYALADKPANGGSLTDSRPQEAGYPDIAGHQRQAKSDSRTPAAGYTEKMEVGGREGDAAVGRAREELTSLLIGLGPYDDAGEMQAGVVEALRGVGFDVTEEAEAPYGDDRAGRVDLLAHRDGLAVALELDRKSPRRKSVEKLRALAAMRVILLREDGPDLAPPAGIHLVLRLTGHPGVSKSAKQALASYREKLAGCRAALQDYLAEHVPEKKQAAYVHAVACWLDDPAAAFQKPTGGWETDRKAQVAILAEGVNELAAGNEEGMKWPVGDVRNLKTKIGVLLQQRHDGHYRRGKRNGRGADTGGAAGSSPGEARGRHPKAGDRGAGWQHE